MDDTYGTLHGTEHNIWDQIKSYITKINNYFKNNYLINNIDKTQIMLIMKNQALKEINIKLNDTSISHSKKVKVLGTTFNENLNWKDHLEIGNNCLITQLKQRKSAILRLSKRVSKKFLPQYSNSILISKLNHHIKLWGSYLKTIKNKIDDIQLSIAIKLIEKP